MNNIERHIYMGDIHGSYLFERFIEKYNDGKTHFYSLGDLFDRGNYSYQNFLIMKKLVLSGKMTITIGNHDIFFIMSKGLKLNGKMKELIKRKIQENPLISYDRIQKLNEALYYGNGGSQTDASFKTDLIDTLIEKENGEYNDEDLKEIDKIAEKRMSDVANFLWEYGNIINIDENKNVLIHGGIPILPTGHLVGTIIDNKGMEYGIDLIKKLNEGFKNLDYEKIGILDSSISPDEYYQILNNLERYGDVSIDNIYIYEEGRYLSCIWYENALYDTNDRVRNTLISELNSHGLNNIFLGHWWNKEIDDGSFKNVNSKYWKNNIVIRLDRSYNYGTIGFAIFDNRNKMLEVGEYGTTN